MATKSRSELKRYFVKNAIPTESNFAELIDSPLNQVDDGVFRQGSGEPLSVVAATGDQKRALQLYVSYPALKPDWGISLNPKAVEAPNALTPGFGIVDSAGNTRLLIDARDGRLSVGSHFAYGGQLNKLDVAESLSAHVRVADLQIGHPTRRGSVVGQTATGRALIDNTTELVINWAQDWQQTKVDSPLSVTGALTVNGSMRASGEIQSTSMSAFRMMSGNYGALWRIDGENTYLLFTNVGDPYGSWNNLRPFAVQNSTGNVTLSRTTVSGNLDVAGSASLGGARDAGGSFNTPLLTGFHEGNNAVGAPPQSMGSPDHHLIVSRHSRLSGNYQLQISSSFANDEKLYFRKIAGEIPGYVTPPWTELATVKNGNMAVSGTLSVNGAVTASSHVSVGGDLTIAGTTDLGRARSVDNFNAALSSGFYQAPNLASATGAVPDPALPSLNWSHMLVVRHSNALNNFQLQIASTYSQNDKLYFRKIARGDTGVGGSPWNEVATSTGGVLKVEGATAGTGVLKIGAWTLEASNEQLLIKVGTKIVASFHDVPEPSLAVSRFAVYTNQNGQHPYFYVTGLGSAGAGMG